MWIGDVGETTREEVSVSDPASSYEGQHFGYPFHEGTTDWSMDGGDLRLDKDCDQDFSPSRPCVAPVTDYENERMGGANCVIGGLIPEGCGWADAFDGKLHYWFADYGASWVHAIEVKPDRSGAVSPDPLEVGTFGSAGPAAIRQGPNGAVYMVNNKEGSVYEIKPKNQTGDGCMSMGGMGGMGGASGSGGSTPMAGSTAMTAGRDGAGGSGGRVASGGSGGSATAGSGQAGSARKPAASEESGGCGCRVSKRDDGALAAAMAGLGLAGLTLRRRRFSRWN